MGQGPGRQCSALTQGGVRTGPNASAAHCCLPGWHSSAEHSEIEGLHLPTFLASCFSFFLFVYPSPPVPTLLLLLSPLSSSSLRAFLFLRRGRDQALPRAKQRAHEFCEVVLVRVPLEAGPETKQQLHSCIRRGLWDIHIGEGGGELGKERWPLADYVVQQDTPVRDENTVPLGKEA